MRLFTTLDMVDHNVQVLNGEYSLPPEILAQCRSFIDVGACHGAFSLWVTSMVPGIRGLAFEPMPKSGARAQKTLDVHALGDLVWLIAGAVDAVPGTAILTHLSGGNAGENRIGLGDGKAEGWEPVCECDVYQAAQLPDTDLLKVDTEGNEVAIVSNYLAMRAKKPLAIVCEYHSQECLRELIATTQRHGYRVLSVQGYGPNTGLLKVLRG